MTDERLARLLLKLKSPVPELSALEQVQARAYVLRLVNQWTAVEEAYAAGLDTDRVHLAAYDQSEYKILAPLQAAAAK